jgi:hypothetical protein
LCGHFRFFSRGAFDPRITELKNSHIKCTL